MPKSCRIETAKLHKSYLNQENKMKRYKKDNKYVITFKNFANELKKLAKGEIYFERIDINFLK